MNRVLLTRNTEHCQRQRFLPLFVLLATGWWANIAFGQEEAIFANDRFVFYKDRLETRDRGNAVYRSSDGLAITRNGHPHRTRNRFRQDKLYLQTPFPILDAAFALAVDETLGCIAPAGTKSAQLGPGKTGGIYHRRYYYLTHGKDIREYTRDTAQHVQLGDSVIIDRDAAEGSIVRRFVFENKRIREDYIVTADSVHLISAVLEYYRITGDKGFLRNVWDCMWNEMIAKEAVRKKEDGLWLGSLWADHGSGFIEQEHFENRNKHVKSLYANTLVADAWKSLAEMADLLGFQGEKETAEQNYLELKTAINQVLYRPELGTYCYYKYDVGDLYYDYRENVSAGLIYLAGVADKKKTIAYHNRFTATPYGYRNVDPVIRKETEWMGGNVWDVQEAYHAWALARLNKGESLKDFIFWHARAGIVPNEWREGTINPTTGKLNNNYKRFACSAMAYTSYWTRGIFGVTYEFGGIRFDPCVPPSFGDDFFAVLNNFTYREGSLRIILRGQGYEVARVTLNGRKVATIPGEIKGKNTIEILMKNHVAIPVPEPVARATVTNSDKPSTK